MARDAAKRTVTSDGPYFDEGKRMKIAYLLATSEGSWGGMERHVFDLAGRMAAAGHAVHVIAQAAYQVHCPTNVGFVPFNWARHRWSPKLWVDLRRLLTSIKPQIAHTHGGKAAEVLSRAGWPADVKVVGSVHGTKSQHRAYRRFHAVVAVSRQLAEGIHHPNVRVIHNGINSHDADAEGVKRVLEWLQGKPSPLVLAVGRLAHVKGFDILLEAWPEQIEATLALLGEGPERDRLESIVQRRGLRNVHFLGHRVDVREWMDCADLMVMSSRREGFPYVLIEALQAGLPVVSTSVSGVNEILTPAWLVPTDSAADMNAMLSRVLKKNKSEMVALQHESIVYARSALTLGGMAEAMENLYADLLRARGD